MWGKRIQLLPRKDFVKIVKDAPRKRHVPVKIM